MKQLFLLSIIFIFIGCATTDDSNMDGESMDDDIMGDGNPGQELVLNTLIATQVTATSAVSGGEIVDDGGFDITNSGIVWSTNQNPTVDDEIIIDGSTSGTYAVSLSCLLPETPFYVRAFVEYSGGVFYADQIGFNTTNHVVFNGDVELLSQADVISFGANGFTKINGNLTLGNSNGTASNIEDLQPIAEITEIIGDVNIVATNVSDIDLNCLRTVSGFVSIAGNDVLNDVGGLSRIEEIGGSFQISNNPVLTTVNGFTRINTLLSLTLRKNPSLQDIQGLNGVETVSGLFFEALNASEATALASGMSNLSEVNGGGGMTIKAVDPNFSLNITGFENLINIEGRFDLGSGFQIPDTGFPNLKRIGQGLRMENNTTSGGIAGFNALETVSLIRIFNCNYTSVTGFNSLNSDANTSINVEIINNNFLTDISGFNGLTEANQFLVFNAPNLTTYSLNNLETVTTQVLIDGTGLSTFGLNNLISLQSLGIVRNNGLTDYCSLENLINNGSVASYVVANNAYNPTINDIMNGDCSL